MNDKQSATNRLAQTLALRPMETDHADVTAQLTDYVAAQLAGQGYFSRFADVARHLDACIECAEAYNLLYELAVAEADEHLAQPGRWPEPDLTFLTPPAGASLLDQVRAAVQRIGEQIRLQLSPDLFVALRPAYAPSTLRGPADAQRYGEVLLRLELTDELAADWPASIAIYRDAHHPEDALVEVTVEPPGRSWPDLEGITVTLVTDDEELVGVSDAWGLVTFERVPIVAIAGMRVLL